MSPLRESPHRPATPGAGPAAADAPVTVVTGLPRSGTSMVMQMLVAGGCQALLDQQRAADASNPYGYYEYAPVTRLHAESGWLSAARGRVVKVVAPLLRFLPLVCREQRPLTYRVIFLQRDLGQVVASQQRLLRCLGREHAAPPVALLIPALQQELDIAERWIGAYAEASLDLDFLAVLAAPRAAAQRLSAFVPGLDTERAAAAVVPLAAAGLSG